MTTVHTSGDRSPGCPAGDPIRGPGAISEVVEDALNDLGLSVERIAGANRYATVVLITEKLRDEGADFETAFIAVGTNFADALAASSYAAMQGEPILLVQPNRLPSATEGAFLVPIQSSYKGIMGAKHRITYSIAWKVGEKIFFLTKIDSHKKK